MYHQNTSISTSGIKKSYGGKEVLRDVNLSASPGTVYALLGSNGAGKTTLVKILSTLLKPDGGDAAVAGFHVVTQEKSVRRCISLTGQFTAVDEALTGRENLLFTGRFLGLSRGKARAKAEEWLSFFDLQDASNQRVSSYSGGMTRRLDLAMSLMVNPQVLFLDEPTTGLDPQNRIAMWDYVKSLAGKGTTVFLTTQYLEEAEYLADYVGILHQGKILIEGTPQHLKEIMPKPGAQLSFRREAEAARAMKLLAEQGVPVEKLEANLPTLEDVFLTLTNESKEEQNHG